jgi:hypothetical protein
MMKKQENMTSTQTEINQSFSKYSYLMLFFFFASLLLFPLENLRIMIHALCAFLSFACFRSWGPAFKEGVQQVLSVFALSLLARAAILFFLVSAGASEAFRREAVLIVVFYLFTETLLVLGVTQKYKLTSFKPATVKVEE